MKRTTTEYVDSLIDFYSKTEFQDEKYLRELIVKNLKNIKRKIAKDKEE